MSDETVPTRRWTRIEYERLIDTGILREDEPVELVDGQLIVREPRHAPHAAATQLVADALRAAGAAGWHVRVQLPLAIDPDSEPEPDVALVAGTPREYVEEHPATAALVVEVAFGSLQLDRTVKGALYARARVPEYWVVNLADDMVEVYREPGQVPGPPPAWGYTSVERLRAGDVVAPLAIPSARLAVADLLP